MRNSLCPPQTNFECSALNFLMLILSQHSTYLWVIPCKGELATIQFTKTGQWDQASLNNTFLAAPFLLWSSNLYCASQFSWIWCCLIPVVTFQLDNPLPTSPHTCCTSIHCQNLLPSDEVLFSLLQDHTPRQLCCHLPFEVLFQRKAILFGLKGILLQRWVRNQQRFLFLSTECLSKQSRCQSQ